MKVDIIATIKKDGMLTLLFLETSYGEGQGVRRMWVNAHRSHLLLGRVSIQHGGTTLFAMCSLTLALTAAITHIHTCMRRRRIDDIGFKHESRLRWDAFFLVFARLALGATQRRYFDVRE